MKVKRFTGSVFWQCLTDTMEKQFRHYQKRIQTLPETNSETTGGHYQNITQHSSVKNYSTQKKKKRKKSEMLSKMGVFFKKEKTFFPCNPLKQKMV